MPLHNGFLPREGFTADPLLTLISRTVMNPVFLVPAFLLAKFTNRGETFTALHPTAFSHFKTLCYFGLVSFVSRTLSDGVENSWTSDKYDWPNEIAVITGGAGVIGGHVVRLLAERGIKVVVLDIQPMTFEAGPNVYYFKCDITSSANVAEVAKQIRARVGEPTILINNAGVARGKTILETGEKDLQFTFDVNTFAHYRTVQAFLPSMIRRNHGMVVTIASYASWLPVPNMVDYAMSKASSLAFHEGLSAELKTRYNAPKVRTIVINPGYTKTPLFTGFDNGSSFLTPPLEPESVADAICRQIFTGRSGQVITPMFGRVFSFLGAVPHWISYSFRIQGQSAMARWKGRQVVEDVEGFYSGREGGGK